MSYNYKSLETIYAVFFCLLLSGSDRGANNFSNLFLHGRWSLFWFTRILILPVAATTATVG